MTDPRAAVVYLIRHGESTGGPGDPGLSEEGRGQAGAAAQRLHKVGVSAVITSPLRPARETAEIIAAALARGVEEDLRLRERGNWGDRPGQSRAEFVADWDASTADPDLALSGGRSARTRGNDVLQVCGERPAGSVTAAITHGGAIGDCLLNLLSIEEVRDRHPSFPDMLPCSITTLRVDRRDIYVESVARPSFTT